MANPSRSLKLKAGELVVVRSLPEILATLDANARLDALPFMPQMLRYCGQTLRVRKRAHKLCDTAFATGARKMADAVFLEGVECDGQAFGGCEMRCQIFWKDAWLKRVGDTQPAVPAAAEAVCSEADVLAGARKLDSGAKGEPVYACQATQIVAATQSLRRFEMAQYVEDYQSGNASLWRVVSCLLFHFYSRAEKGGLGALLRWPYDLVHKLCGRWPYPCRPGLLPKGKTPSVKLDLQVGELIRVREQTEILKTVDRDLINRGMCFHAEMVPYCGKEFRVQQRVGKIINERTGQLMVLKNDCVVLEGPDCVGRYTQPLNCPRGAYPYWREIWLERVDQVSAAPNPNAADSPGAGD